MAAEHLGEMRGGVEPAGHRDVGDRLLCLHDQVPGAMQPHFGDVAFGRAVQELVEQPFELPRPDIKFGGDVRGVSSVLRHSLQKLDGARQMRVPHPVPRLERDALGRTSFAHGIVDHLVRYGGG